MIVGKVSSFHACKLHSRQTFVQFNTAWQWPNSTTLCHLNTTKRILSGAKVQLVLANLQWKVGRLQLATCRGNNPEHVKRAGWTCLTEHSCFLAHSKQTRVWINSSYTSVFSQTCLVCSVPNAKDQSNIQKVWLACGCACMARLWHKITQTIFLLIQFKTVQADEKKMSEALFWFSTKVFTLFKL